MPGAAAGSYVDYRDEACEDVSQREEHNGRGPGIDRFGELRHRVLGQFHKVSMGQLAPLGTTGRAGGVDNGGQIAQPGGAALRFELLITDLLAGLA